MAHLLEHMLFLGSKNHPKTTEEFRAHGAQWNGSTNVDRTNYFETFPATEENLKWAIAMEADRMVNSFVAKQDLDKEMTVVRNEFEMGENEPSRVLFQRTRRKRARCRFIWLSATVDPTFYARYLNSQEVLETSAFDPALRARVRVLAQKPDEFLDDKYIRHIMKEQRGVAVFVPTRAEVEQLAKGLGERWPRLNAAFYHGGEPIRVIRPFLEGEVEHPFLLAMTAAGQSALNVRGLDTVVIYDARYGNVVDRGRNVLHRLHLGDRSIHRRE